MTTQDINFLSLTDDIATKSKDFSTKVGAIIVDEGDSTPKSFGYNGLPRGLDDNKLERTQQRPEKYFWNEHAERNAIYNLARKTMNDTMIICSHFPNMESARAIVSSGIGQVVLSIKPEFIQEYQVLNTNHEVDKSPEHKNYERVTSLFRESGVKVINVETDKHLLKINKYIDYLETVKKYGDKFCKEMNKKSAMIFDKNTFNLLSGGSGVYGLPHGLNIELSEEEKPLWTIEAEKNAIFNAMRSQLKNTTFYASLCPCMDCALAIASVGAKKVVTRKPEFINEVELRWQESFLRSQRLFNAMNIETLLFTEQEINPPKTTKKLKG